MSVSGTPLPIHGSSRFFTCSEGGNVPRAVFKDISSFLLLGNAPSTCFPRHGISARVFSSSMAVEETKLGFQQLPVLRLLVTHYIPEVV